MVVHAINYGGRQRRADICEFLASQVCIVGPRASQWDPFTKKKKLINELGVGVYL